MSIFSRSPVKLPTIEQSRTIPLIGFPEGRARFRFRSDTQIPRLFIFSKEGIRAFIPKVTEAGIEPLCEQGANIRRQA